MLEITADAVKLLQKIIKAKLPLGVEMMQRCFYLASAGKYEKSCPETESDNARPAQMTAIFKLYASNSRMLWRIAFNPSPNGKSKASAAAHGQN